MNAAASYPLRIPQNLIELANLRTKEEHVDKSTALRQLLYMGAQDYVIELYGSGRISLSKAAQLLDTSTLDVSRIASERNLLVGAAKTQQEKSRETANNLSI
jgi:hypothetical protein